MATRRYNITKITHRLFNREMSRKNSPNLATLNNGFKALKATP